MTNEINTAAVATVETSARGRKPILDNVSNVVAALVAIQAGDTENMPSRRTLLQMVDAEYLTVSDAERAEGQRGRSNKVYSLTDETKAWLETAITAERDSARDAQRNEIAAMLAQETEAEAGLKSLKEAIKAKKAELKAAESADAKALKDAEKAKAKAEAEAAQAAQDAEAATEETAPADAETTEAQA